MNHARPMAAQLITCTLYDDLVFSMHQCITYITLTPSVTAHPSDPTIQPTLHLNL